MQEQGSTVFAGSRQASMEFDRSKLVEYRKERGARLMADDNSRSLHEDLVVFRWLERQISNKKAITACLLVLEGIACNAEPPAADQVAET